MSDTLKKVNDSLDNVIKQMSTSVNFDEKDFLSNFYPKQLRYILNEEKSMRTLFYGGARAGKSYANMGKIIWTDIFYMPEVRGRIVIASATQGKAMDLYWDNFRKIKEAYNFPWEFEKKKEKINTRTNEIVFRGLKDIANAHKDQGFKIKLCVVEEPQTIRVDILEHYVNNVIASRCIELSGEICYTGNPPHFPHPFIMKEYKNKENKVIQTNIFDNESIDPEKKISYISRERKRRGFKEGEEDASFRREFYGEMVQDDNLLIFKINKEKNFYGVLPLETYQYEKVMGIDIGWHDYDAIVVLYYCQNTGKIYVVEEDEENKQTFERLMVKINSISAKHGGIDLRVFDTGGLGKKGMESMMEKYETYFITADKQNKMNYVEILRSEIRAGRVLFKKDSSLAKEFEQIVYTYNKEKIDDKQYHSDLLDALLYAFRYVFNHIKKEEKDSVDEDEERMGKYIRLARSGSANIIEDETGSF